MSYNLECFFYNSTISNSVMVTALFLLIILAANFVRFFRKATLKKIASLIRSGAERLSSKQKAAASIPA